VPVPVPGPVAGRRWAFVVGPARTGTTIAAWLLSQHPECRILIDTAMVKVLRMVLRPPVAGVYQVDMKGLSGVSYLEYAPLAAWDRQFADDAADALMRGWAEQVRIVCGDPLVFGDKDPSYCYHWPEILRLWPDATIIRTDRDRDAAVESLMRTRWWLFGKRESVRRSAALRVQVLQRAAVRDCPAAYVMRLEQLEADPERTILDMLAAVGLSADGYPMRAALLQVEKGRLS